MTLTRAFIVLVVAFSVALLASAGVLMLGSPPADTADDTGTLAPDANECGEGNFTMEQSSHGCDDQLTTTDGRESGHHARA